MSRPYAATAEQWADMERWSRWQTSSSFAMCILELRARIEALEALIDEPVGPDP